MKRLLALEELAQFALAIYAITTLHTSIDTYILVIAFFSPDLFMVGYFVSPKVGMVMYNFSHHRFTAIALIFYGLLMSHPIILLTGLLFFAHSSFDRILGYGLKYSDSFSHTHLGYIGKEKSRNPADAL